MKRLSIALILAIALSPSLLCAEPLPSSRYEDLNEKIFGHLELLSDKAHADRMLGGGVSLVLGGLFVGGGVLVLSDNPASLPEVEMIGYTCVGAGALLGLLSLPTLLIPSAEEKAFAKYQDYPSRSEREVKSKYEKGERDFRDLADSRKQGRIMSGGTSIALGAGYVLFSGSIYGATLVGSGLVSLLIPSTAEKEWEIYQEEKEELEAL